MKKIFTGIPVQKNETARRLYVLAAPFFMAGNAFAQTPPFNIFFSGTNLYNNNGTA